MPAWMLILLLAPPPIEARTHNSTRAEFPPEIDGDLSDPAWQKSKPTGDFTQFYPDTGKPASFATEVRVLHDDHNLYIGALCRDPEPEKIVARVTRRDHWIEADWFRVDLDSRLDHRSGFHFTVNAANVQMDGTYYDENQMSNDWDGVWESATSIGKDGWTVEIRIPLKLLRFRAGDDVRFGLNFIRTVSRSLEADQWQFIPPESGKRVSKYGLLTGLDLKKRPVQLEVIPYIAGRPDIGWGAPASSAIRPFDAGVDARVGLGSNFMLTLTANPDFGQVEVDQVVLNLSTIETYYPEKRPFFLEDRSFFQTMGSSGGDGGGPAQLFYTRRIGRAPRTPDMEDDQELVRMAHLPRIWGAMKLAGQTEGRLSVGVLQAVTSAEDALIGREDGSEFSRLAEPFTSFSILRLKQDFWHHSSAGLMATSVITPDHGSAFTGGTDLQMELFDKKYQLEVLTFVSSLTEDRYGWHDSYIQAALDRDGAFGYGGRVKFAKVHGEHLVGSASVMYLSPNLALNDLGYLDRPDRFFINTQVTHHRLKPLGPIARYGISTMGWVDRTTGGLDIGDGFMLDGWTEFLNGWGTGIWVFSAWPLCDDRETRTQGEVPLCGEDYRWRAEWWGYTDSRKPVQAGLTLGWRDTEHGGALYANPHLIMNLHPRLQLELLPRYSRLSGTVRWIDTEELASGDRFLFADQRYEYWDVTFRGTYTFTTTLTLQAFVQVFLVGVDHKKKYEAPSLSPSKIHVADLIAAPDVPDDYDYTASNLNLSVVLRWEYLPGSVAYLVYTGAFGNSQDVADFRFGDVLNDLFLAPAEHVLLFKISYFWG